MRSPRKKEKKKKTEKMKEKVKGREEERSRHGMLMKPAVFLVFAAMFFANPATDSTRRAASHGPRWAITRSILAVDPHENTVSRSAETGFLIGGIDP